MSAAASASVAVHSGQGVGGMLNNRGRAYATASVAVTAHVDYANGKPWWHSGAWIAWGEGGGSMDSLHRTQIVKGGEDKIY